MHRVPERYPAARRLRPVRGNVKPHKNLERLIDAFHLLRQRGLDHLTLVVIGDEISKYAALRRAVHRYNLHKHVRFLGYMPDDDAGGRCTAWPRCSCFPSLYEGFGLPPLEAMASGTPVVTSNVSSLPEVAGGAAVLVDPRDSQSIADGLARVLTDSGASRGPPARAGSVRAAEFSWERSVRRTQILSTYGTVASER